MLQVMAFSLAARKLQAQACVLWRTAAPRPHSLLHACVSSSKHVIGARIKQPTSTETSVNAILDSHGKLL